MSGSYNEVAIEQALSPERLSTYKAATPNETMTEALGLYRWNIRVSAAVFELIGVIEVTVRNAMDAALRDLAVQRGWPHAWYREKSLFQGKQGQRSLKDIATAIDRATGWGGRPEVHGKVVAELNFGFWRFLLAKHYFTAMWVPATHRAFSHHPGQVAHDQVRSTSGSRISTGYATVSRTSSRC